jgi:hypothetical protein
MMNGRGYRSRAWGRGTRKGLGKGQEGDEIGKKMFFDGTNSQMSLKTKDLAF